MDSLITPKELASVRHMLASRCSQKEMSIFDALIQWAGDNRTEQIARNDDEAKCVLLAHVNFLLSKEKEEEEKGAENIFRSKTFRSVFTSSYIEKLRATAHCDLSST